jgi:8-oxo-dGTP pyrophosphatase MutT (NUDIX family)
MQIYSEIVTAPPLDSATVVMLRDSPTGLEVLLLKRHAASSVLGGAFVFPGGKLDVADAHPDLLQRLDRTPTALHKQLGEADLPEGKAASLFVAALREAFEESSVLLAHSAAGQSHADTLAAARDHLSQGMAFNPLLAQLNLTLHTDALVPWSRWITPRVPSVTNKRFDTRFFLARAPTDQIAAHDNHETTESVWLAPREALTRTERRCWARSSTCGLCGRRPRSTTLPCCCVQATGSRCRTNQPAEKLWTKTTSSTKRAPRSTEARSSWISL